MHPQSLSELHSEKGVRTRFTPSSLLAKNALLNLVTNGWIFLVLLVAIPKLVHYLGETSFGLFSLAWVVIGYLAFLDIGVNRAATKFVSQHLAEQDRRSALRLVQTAIIANSVMGLMGGLAVAIASPYLVHHFFKVSLSLEREARLAFYAVGLSVPVLLVQGVFRAVLSSFQRFGWMNAIDAVTTSAQWIVAGILAWEGHGVALVVFSTVLARIIGTLACGYLVFRLFPDFSVWRIRSLYGLSKLLHFGSWVSVSQIISPLLVYLDRVLIASWVSLSAVTLYTVPFEALGRLRVIPFSLMGTIYPAFSERGAANGMVPDLERLYERSVRYLLLLLAPGILYLLVLGPDLFQIWMGPAFAQQTASVVQILCLGVLANALAPVPFSLLQAYGRPDLPGKFHLIELPIYFALCWFLIPRWGITGAALACTARYCLDAFLLFWAAAKYCQVSLHNFVTGPLVRIAALFTCLTMTLIAAKALVHGAWLRLIAGAVVVALSFISVWMFAIHADEKPRLGGVLKNLLGQAAS